MNELTIRQLVEVRSALVTAIAKARSFPKPTAIEVSRSFAEELGGIRTSRLASGDGKAIVSLMRDVVAADLRTMRRNMVATEKVVARELRKREKEKQRNA